MNSTYNLPDLMNKVAQRLQEDHAEELLIKTFCRHLDHFVSSDTTYIRETEIRPVSGLLTSESLQVPSNTQDLLARTAVFKLNGGLGTSMGLSKAKSLLKVKNGLSFLQIIIEQILHLRKHSATNIPLLFMNSFATEKDTQEVLKQYPQLSSMQNLPFTFVQNRVPKLSQSTLEPVDYAQAPELTWCPPGHGDFYTCLVTTGLLDVLLQEGIEYAFISNADNLGATLDPTILNYFATNDVPFMMEVTRRTEADRKGGHLALGKTKGLLLRESAQCHPDDAESFQDIHRHQYFNTNNLWINLQHLKNKMQEHENVLPMPVIANSKTVAPKDESTEAVYQLETAMGAAIGIFPTAQAIDVPRTRFAPVKTTNDLLALWSDIFILDEASHIVKNPARELSTPNIDLNPEYYRLLDDFSARFPCGAPSLIHCRNLQVKGDYVFEEGITARGDVTLRETQEQTTIPSNTALSNDIELRTQQSELSR